MQWLRAKRPRDAGGTIMKLSNYIRGCNHRYCWLQRTVAWDLSEDHNTSEVGVFQPGLSARNAVAVPALNVSAMTLCKVPMTL